MTRTFLSALPTSRRRFATIAFLLALFVLSCVRAGAQTSYADYPQKRGKTEGFAWSELPKWMTVSLETRSRTEGQTSFSYVQNADRTYDLTRALGSVEVRPTSHITGYMQFIDTHALGLPLHTVSSNMRDVFDLHQGWLNVHGTAGRVPISVISGRQELRFGSERIIGVSDWSNNSRTWDGFDLRIGDRNRVDLFSTSVVTVHPSSLDTHGAGLTFHGAYAQLTHFIPRVHLSPYVLFHDVRGVTSLQGIKGNEVETTFGSEIQGKLPARFCYLANGSLQRGSYANDSIHAGQALAKVYYSAPASIFWQPRLGVEYNYATGNDHSNPLRYATYDQQYPSNHNAFGNVDLFGYQNMRQERINLDIAPAPSFTILVQGGFLNVAERKDSVYSSSGSATIKAPTAGFASNVIGQELDVTGKYVFHDYLVANVGVGHLFPGALLLQNKHGAAETIGYFGLTYRLRVDQVKADR
ncbi:hypothetical protein HDF16_001324 [Granulicella aggregans]|uniref:Alginate export domain-containing protein n=1 Tax=Granulicella aggregans TaxID=474949 RepID=A0A7W7ZBN8_9BACT|nr:alginate export family protein [Granulicella aggregans]MBB5056639.1 hypothetical protein [Granulicella aggregans]